MDRHAAPLSVRSIAVLFTAVAHLMIPGRAEAQSAPQPLPGIVVTTPQPPPPPAAAPIIMTFPPPAPPSGPVTVTVAPPPPAAPQPAPAVAPPKPKPKAAQKPAAPRTAPVGTPIATGSAGAIDPTSGRALMFINDEPITAYQLDARARLMLLGTNIGEKAAENMKRLVQSEETGKRWRKLVEDTIQQNPGKSQQQIMAILEQKKAGLAASLREQAIAGARQSVIPVMRKQAKDDLIEEQLKLQEAKRLNITVDDKEIDGIMRNLAERNKMDDKQFAAHLKSLGADASAMRERFKATLAWNEVVRRTFGNQVNVNERDIDRFAAKGSKGEEQIELKVSRITIPLPAKVDQRTMAEKYDLAERIRQAHKGCKNMSAEATRNGAKYEDLGFRKPDQFQDPLRVMLASAQENEMVPPNVTGTGIELLAVCQRNVVTANEQKRQEVLSDLRQKEFEVRARGLLADLRSKALINDPEKQASR